MPAWTEDERRTRARWILRSYRHWAGVDLVDAGSAPTGAASNGTEAASDDDEARARALFDAPFAVLAHDTRPDPLCVYMNAAALAAFELSLDEAAAFPTRRTAEPDARQERRTALAGAEQVGLVTGYEGIRVTTSGRRFRLLDGRIWTVLDDDGQRVGQAAAFVPGAL